MYVTCMCEFVFSETIPKWLEKIAIKQFFEARNHAIKILNECFDGWNALYTEEVHGMDDEKYNKYIADKENIILNEVNELLGSKSLIKLKAGESADIEGEFEYRGKTVTMKLRIESVVK